jgi:hypothetical protein
MSFSGIGCGGTSSDAKVGYVTPPEYTAALEGEVVNSVLGSAVPDAILILENGFVDYSAMTDGRGIYRFDNVEPGSYRLTAGKGGYVTVNTSINIEQGQVNYSTVILDPYVSTGTLHGTVVRYSSTSSIPVPLEGASVYFPNPGVSYMTDSSGRFSAPNLPAGINTFILSLAGYQEHRVLVDITPDTVDERTFEMLDLSGGLEGCVTGLPSMNPLTGILVSIDALELTTVTGADGCYAFSGVTSGIWPVDFLADRYTPSQIVTSIVEGRTTVLDAALSYGFGTVSGIVNDSISGLPVGGATISMPVSGLTSTTNVFGEYGFYNIVRTGTFVPVGSAHSSYLSSGTYITLSPAQVVTVNFLMNPKYGALTGIVRTTGGVPIVGASLTISPYSMSTVSDGTGTYYFSNLLPGSTPVTVSATGYQTTVKSITTTAGTTTYGDITLSSAP